MFIKVKHTKRGGGLLKTLEYYQLGFGGRERRVKAGWDTRSRNKDEQYPCQYMRINEYGTSTIPPRPALRITSKKNRPQWLRMQRRGMQAKISPVRMANLLGSRMKSDIQETIVSSVPPPNAPGTRRAKEKRGNSGGTLRDTLFAFQQVTYVVEEE